MTDNKIHEEDEITCYEVYKQRYSNSKGVIPIGVLPMYDDWAVAWRLALLYARKNIPAPEVVLEKPINDTSKKINIEPLALSELKTREATLPELQSTLVLLIELHNEHISSLINKGE